MVNFEVVQESLTWISISQPDGRLAGWVHASAAGYVKAMGVVHNPSRSRIMMLVVHLRKDTSSGKPSPSELIPIIRSHSES